MTMPRTDASARNRSGAGTGRDPGAAAAVIDQLAAVAGRDRLYEHYHTLRAADPIHQSRHEIFPTCWFISRHEDVDRIRRDRRFVWLVE